MINLIIIYACFPQAKGRVERHNEIKPTLFCYTKL